MTTTEVLGRSSAGSQPYNRSFTVQDNRTDPFIKIDVRVIGGAAVIDAVVEPDEARKLGNALLAAADKAEARRPKKPFKDGTSFRLSSGTLYIKCDGEWRAIEHGATEARTTYMDDASLDSSTSIVNILTGGRED